MFGTGCGGGGADQDSMLLATHPPLNSRLSLPAFRLASLAEEFGRRSALHRMTGGVHACGIADTDKVLLFAEDVSRHNAFDKAAGMAVRGGLDTSQKIALTTCRLSAGIVGKAIAHGLPILASRSAPTAMGLQLAQRFGLTLVGFLRGQRMNVYTGYQRVTPGEA